MGRYYSTKKIELRHSVVIDRFSHCKYIRVAEKHVIVVPADIKLYFRELLYYRFMYSCNDDSPLYLVWDSNDSDIGFQTLTPQKSSERFFAILKYIWQKKEKHG